MEYEILKDTKVHSTNKELLSGDISHYVCWLSRCQRTAGHRWRSLGKIQWRQVAPLAWLDTLLNDYL
jgi:hypothetical protein